jgi:hypothetical protein
VEKHVVEDFFCCKRLCFNVEKEKKGDLFMDQHVESHLIGEKTARRQFFKKAAVGISSALTASALVGISVPGIASAHTVHAQVQLPQNTQLRLCYRLYNPHNGDHFYTIDGNEATNAINNAGYQSEGSACYVLGGHADETSPLYRLYNQQNGDHFYTTNKREAEQAAHSGYHSEGIACYVLPTNQRRRVSFAVPLYRLYNSGNGDHFYTTNSSERDAAAHGGYAYEGIACYVL